MNKDIPWLSIKFFPSAPFPAPTCSLPPTTRRWPPDWAASRPARPNRRNSTPSGARPRSWRP
nr:MAG TPA: hypothetical protein [Caudoviricetes sp.]